MTVACDVSRARARRYSGGFLPMTEPCHPCGSSRASGAVTRSTVPGRRADTRPTSDMVRESLFNIVRELVVDRLVIDLFAGTGALGLEALSRGAERAIFVEKDRENVSLIIRNIATLRYEDRAQVKSDRRLSLGPLVPAPRRPPRRRLP